MSDRTASDSELSLWEVFVQERGGDAHVHAGSVHAGDAEMALQNARDTYARRGAVASLWVVPSAEIAATEPGDAASFFAPADDKIYRHPQFYKIPRGTRAF
ncbi:MAG: ring,2-phenylacetyl-CoA epoxidase subunit PaaB [Candidatus Binatota bacterium]|nr:ring,2-phenylacetyl-CoA epoxidase subunit PaaB [Candidatus Binatota bacterium]